MGKEVWTLLEDIDLQEGCSIQAIEAIQASVGFTFPSTYIKFLLQVNGYEGGVGENGWMVAYKLEELKEINEDYMLLMEQIPDYFLFGRDAADTGYAFHKRDKTFHSFGMMSNFETDNIDFCGNNFEEFLMHVSKG